LDIPDSKSPIPTPFDFIFAHVTDYHSNERGEPDAGEVPHPLLGEEVMPIYPFKQDDTAKPIHGGPRFSRGESHEIFKEMVRAELRNGPLAPRRRKRLIQYAAALQLHPLEASRIITSISRASGHATQPPEFFKILNFPKDHESTQRHWPIWVKIALPLAAAFLIDQIIRGLF
jgi:hypothetical protein